MLFITITAILLGPVFCGWMCFVGLYQDCCRYVGRFIKKEPIEITLLRDADKMDVFGPIGVARMIMARAKRGDNLKEIVDKFYGEDIKRRWQAIKTPEAKALTKDSYRYSRDFFSRLHRLLSKSDDE